MTVAMLAPDPIVRLGRDVRQAATTLTLEEIRFLVDLYYEIQEYRISSANQVRSLERDGEPVALLSWSASAFETVEKEINLWLDKFTAAEPSGVGTWARMQVGIGPVLTAGLLAHIDVSIATTAGKVWSFAGLNPTITWSKGERRPWNARLKVLAWKIGESFVKVSGNPRAHYGHLYAERKARETERNESGAFAEQATQILVNKRIGKETDAYKAYAQGVLPPAHVHSRAKRWAVKRFLSDYQHVAYEARFKMPPPRPWVLEHGGHVHYDPIPNHDCLG